MESSIKRIEELINYLNKCTKAYDEGKPITSDLEWDNAYFELQRLENLTNCYFDNSPTQKISYEVVNGLNKVKHNHLMLSLDKTKDVEIIKSFVKDKETLAMQKLDGLTCTLRYLNGELVSAETRGNGEIGEDITHNARVIQSIPKKIPYKEELIVDGEIICAFEDFENFKSKYKNPRNFAAGSIRLLNSEECRKRCLTFVAWEVIKGFEIWGLLSDRLIAIRNIGFKVVPFLIIDSVSVVNRIDMLKDFKEYPIDGIVFKYNDIDYNKSLGVTNHHPKGAMAFKFYDEEEETELIDIEFSMGRFGILTPVAIFKEVELEGTTVSRASLHNLSIMEDLLGEPYVGQKVSVCKKNEINPQVIKAEKKKEVNNKIKIPLFCPYCGAETEIRTDIEATKLYCTNIHCEGKLINRLDHFVGKKGLDIKGLSLATLGKLMDHGWINRISDIFMLKNYREDWIKLPGFGVKSVDNILQAVEGAKNCELSNFIAALGIPLIGSAVAKDLSKEFKTWDNFINAVENNYKFYTLTGFGTEMSNSILSFDYEEAKYIVENFVTIIEQEEENTSQILKGLNFVVTGRLNKFANRDALKNKIEQLGGKVVGSVSKNTNYLINNDSTSSSIKNKTAKSLNIPIITEEEFIQTFKIQ